MFLQVFMPKLFIIWDVSYFFIFKASALSADAFYKSKYPSVCVCVRLSVHFWGTVLNVNNGLFAPTSQSWMFNIFRHSESLGGKSNGKKWFNIWTFFFGNGLKLPRKKKFFLMLILRVIIVLSCWYAGYNCLRSKC